MNPTARAAVLVLVILGLTESLAPGNLSSHNMLTAMLDGTQPPVPPKMTGTFAGKPDGTQPPVPPKMTGAFAWMFDGTQPPVPPKAVAATV
jgi:hypothetical protein